MGCNSKCAYCIVPSVRGREQSRRPGDIVAEVAALAADGVREVTLLGQNVNSYGRDLLPEIRTGFAELLRACDEVDGIERIRFTSPHPKDFRPDVIEAMADCAAVCEHAHLPLQSGSTAVLKRMRRTYSRERFTRLAGDMRAAIPDLALTTDLIVGFPGETEADFCQTLEAVEEVGFDGAFTFVFSPRSGTEAATMPDQVPDEVKGDRIERLIEVVQRVAAARNAERIGGVEEVLVEGQSRTDATLSRGRTRRNTTVNFAGCATAGELVRVAITGSTLDHAQGRHGRDRGRIVAARDLVWDGCLNVRDLGGLPTENGGSTRFGSVIRADSVGLLTPDGWQALLETGVTRIVDLRAQVEIDEDPPRGPRRRGGARTGARSLRRGDLGGDQAPVRGCTVACSRDRARLPAFPGALPAELREGGRRRSPRPRGRSSSIATAARTAPGSSRRSCCGWPAFRSR